MVVKWVYRFLIGKMLFWTCGLFTVLILRLLGIDLFPSAATQDLAGATLVCASCVIGLGLAYGIWSHNG